jgi:hypothetical protein
MGTVVIVDQHISASMVVQNATFLIGKSAVTFEILGREDSARTMDAVRNLRSLRSNANAELTIQSVNKH